MASKILIRRRQLITIILIISALALGLYISLPKERSELMTIINIPSRISVDHLTKGDTVEAFFQLINAGPNNLKITNIDLDCSCTGYYLDHHLILPGDSGHLSVKVTHTGVGFTRSVIIHCNSEESPIGLKVVGISNPDL